MRDRAVLQRAEEIIVLAARDLKRGNTYRGKWGDSDTKAEHADMLATAKALRAMLEDTCPHGRRIVIGECIDCDIAAEFAHE